PLPLLPPPSFPPRRSSDLSVSLDLRPYPRERISGTTPASRSNGTRAATSGVLPAPPAERLPTLITGHFSFSANSGCRSNRLFFRSEEHTSELQSRFDLVCR